MRASHFAIGLLLILPALAVAEDTLPPAIAPKTNAILRSLILIGTGNSPLVNMGPLTGINGYNGVSVNGTLVPSDMNGVFGSTGDSNLYVNGKSSIQLQVNNTGVVAVKPSGLTVTGSVVETATATPASATSACTVGQHSWDANYDYRCVATNSWKRGAISAW